MLKNTRSDADRLLFRMTFSAKTFSSERRNARLVSEYITEILSVKNPESISAGISDAIPGMDRERDEIIFTVTQNEKIKMPPAPEISCAPETKAVPENIAAVEKNTDENEIKITIPGCRTQ